jgi:predicted transcriptional regulator
MENVQIISLESAEKVLTPKRKEIIRTLRHEDVASVRELARRLGRDKGQVSRDLQVLAEHAVIRYETDGRAKAPRLMQEHIVIEPIV